MLVIMAALAAFAQKGPKKQPPKAAGAAVAACRIDRKMS